MAGYPAIAATSEAILGLVQRAAAGSEFAGVMFKHYQASSFEQPMQEGIALYLYRVTVNGNRNLPARVGLDGRRFAPPIPLDLHYLVIAWATDAIRQQRLLGFAIRAIEDTPILPAGFLNQHGPEADVFRDEESVEVVLEVLSVQDASEIWDVAQSKEQVSATYVARMVEIDSSLPVADLGLVQTRELVMTERGS
jgi:hypothetical protein